MRHYAHYLYQSGGQKVRVCQQRHPDMHIDSIFNTGARHASSCCVLFCPGSSAGRCSGCSRRSYLPMDRRQVLQKRLSSRPHSATCRTPRICCFPAFSCLRTNVRIDSQRSNSHANCRFRRLAGDGWARPKPGLVVWRIRGRRSVACRIFPAEGTGREDRGCIRGPGHSRCRSKANKRQAGRRRGGVRRTCWMVGM